MVNEIGMITLCEFSFYSDYSISRDFERAMTKVPLVSFAELHRMLFNKVIVSKKLSYI